MRIKPFLAIISLVLSAEGMFATCTVLLACYQFNKRTTLQMADELNERRRQSAAQNP